MHLFKKKYINISLRGHKLYDVKMEKYNLLPSFAVRLVRFYLFINIVLAIFRI